MYDLIIIGAGPGGYVSALKASQLGAKVLLIEKDKVGGVCTNMGCIPTKTLLHAAEIIHEIHKAKEFGIVANLSFDYSSLMKKKEEIVSKLRNGIEYLLKANQVHLVYGLGRIKDNHTVKVSSKGEEKTFEGKSMVIASGSSPFKPPIKGIDEKGVITSEEALSLEKLPNSIIIAGGGAEGCEFATIYSSLGVDVTIIEMLPNLLPNEDREIGLRLKALLERKGVKVLTNSKIQKIEGKEGEKKVIIEDGREIKGELVILGLGRKPNSDSLGLENLGIQTLKGRIVVNDKMETNVKGIYAIGDVTGGGFAHEAMEEGIIAVKNIMNKDGKMDHALIPRCIYTIPEVASIGLREEDAKAKGYNISLGRFSFSANGRASTMGEREGFVKVILDRDREEILGVHMLGARVSELIIQVSLLMRIGKDSDFISEAIYPHPTLGEALKEALLDAKGQAIHKVRI
ncbi:MAG: dihydrolipoyl dehydrogenase [Nitrososphaerales archaeon]